MRNAWVGLLFAVFAIVVGREAVATDAASIDWSKIKTKQISLFYPGASTYDWLLTREHKKGYEKVPEGKSCSKCHGDDEEFMGKAVLNEGMAEPKAAPNRRPFIKVALQAAYDKEKLFLRFQWKSDSTGDGKYPDGVAIMIGDKKVKRFSRQGCWLTCHDGMADTRNVPGKDAIAKALKTDKVRKYLPASRTDAKASWDKVKSADALAKIRAAGGFVDLWRWQSDGKVTDESILETRRGDAGKSADDVHAKGELKDGTYTVVMSRKLDTGYPKDDKILKRGKKYRVGLAVHDNNVHSRYHYTSLPLSLGIGTKKGAIKAVKLK